MVGKNIKKFREEKKLTQDALAEKLFVTRQAVSSWECGKTEPDIETLKKISEALDLSTEELIYGTKQKRKILHVAFKFDVEKTVNNGISFGCILAAVISYVKFQSIGWAMLHGFLGWIYVIYYLIQYGWS